MSHAASIASVTATLALIVPATSFASGPLSEPDRSPDPRGLTVNASDVALVKAPAKPSEETIAAAVSEARPRATTRALAQARERAAAVAKSAGVTLGEVVAFRERNPAGDENALYPARYCYVRRPATSRTCSTPRFAAATITVTFATRETSAANAAGVAVTAAGAAKAAVTPGNRRDSKSIREAIVRARLTAAPVALVAARQRATASASAAGLSVSAPFSIAEVQRPFYDDIAFGRFGPGIYCGSARGSKVVRDRRTGKRRRVSLPVRRICPFPQQSFVAFRVTLVSG